MVEKGQHLKMGGGRTGVNLITLGYLEEVDNVDIDNNKRLVDKVDDSVTDGDVGFDHLGHHHTPRMVDIAQEGVGLHVDCGGHEKVRKKPENPPSLSISKGFRTNTSRSGFLRWKGLVAERNGDFHVVRESQGLNRAASNSRPSK